MGEVVAEKLHASLNGHGCVRHMQGTGWPTCIPGDTEQIIITDDGCFPLGVCKFSPIVNNEVDPLVGLWSN